MAMPGTFLRSLLVFLCLSQLICLNAIPFTRTRSLVLKSHENLQVSEDFLMVNMKKNLDMPKAKMEKRMVVELNDYPGSGANNRHTPRPN
ncbi:hypothetical protein Leryth_025630 [Lithospermum erythrorhizon]|nr:hypothetical protein Leryth_025630 [Lithospermum erythrorhizon]